MASAFATPADFAARLGRDLTPAETTQLEQLLADASEDLRGEIGWQVWPPTQVTVTLPALPRHREGVRNVQWWQASVHLPGKPIRRVIDVSLPVVDLAAFPDASGFEISEPWYQLIDGVLWLRWSAEHVTVTYEVGYDAPPAELVRWTCVLAAEEKARADAGIYGAAPATAGVDDFRVGYSAQQQARELPIPTRVLDRLKATYGSTAYVA